MRSRRERHALTGIVIAIAAVCFIVPFAQRGDADDASATSATPTTAVAATAAPSSASTEVASEAAPVTAAPTTDAPAATDPTTTEVDVGGGGTSTTDSCIITVRSLGVGDQGSSVECLQQALVDSGFYSGPVNGQFDQATYDAVRRVQEDRDLYVDGVVGRESAISLGIWPEETSLVVRTPPPPPGAVDLMGYPLSSVATSGPDAPPLPENSGSGRRVVYDRAGQRVWAVDDDGTVIRSWLVSGSKYNNELPGVHQVYSRSEVSTAWNGKAYLPRMIRWLKTDIGHIGFHGIPTHVSDGSPYQTEAELGTRLSGGCQRQANPDARFMWDFAQIGTTVVVI
jgi:peptidoglycan hydrolase-like protein with peptidoglycan-binding domain